MLEDVDAPYISEQLNGGLCCTLHGESFYTQQSMQSAQNIWPKSIYY